MLSVTSKRSVLRRRVFQIELTVVFVGLVVYASLASINRQALLFVIMIASLTVGSFLIPLQLACRRPYVARPFPWNWVAFFPMQLMWRARRSHVVGPSRIRRSAFARDPKDCGGPFEESTLRATNPAGFSAVPG